MLGIAWRRWNWLEGALMPLAAVLMSAAWAYPLFALFLRDPTGGAAQSGFSFWLCLGILLGGLGAGRLARQNRMGMVIVVVGGLAATAITLSLALPRDLQDFGLPFADLLARAMQGHQGEVLPVPIIAAICSVALWWRGLRVARMEHGETTGAFVVGTVAVAGLLLLAAVLPSGPSAQERGHPGVVRFFSSGLAPLIFVASIPAALALAASSRVLGTLGATLSQLALVIGMLSLGIVLPRGPDAQGLAGWVILFLGSGLTALALVGVYHTLREQRRRTGIGMHVDRFWAVTTLSIVAVVLLLGVFVGQLIAPGALVKLIGLLRPLWTVVTQILLLIIFVFAYLFFNLIEPLLAAVQNRPARELSTFRSSITLPQELEQAGDEAAQLPPALGVIIQVVLILGLVAVVAYIFYLAAKHRKEGSVRVEDQIVESRENILSAELLRSQLSGLLDSLRRKRALPMFVDPGPPGDPRRIVREAYQSVLAQAVNLDAPRAKSQTPAAYANTLQQLCPEERGALETLTRVYTATRYSAVPPAHDQVEAVEQALSRISAAMGRVAKIGPDEPGVL